jgi:hypothetical protein
MSRIQAVSGLASKDAVLSFELCCKQTTDVSEVGSLRQLPCHRQACGVRFHNRDHKSGSYHQNFSVQNSNSHMTGFRDHALPIIYYIVDSGQVENVPESALVWIGPAFTPFMKVGARTGQRKGCHVRFFSQIGQQ